MKTLHIASGEYVAAYLKSRNYIDVVAFNEAMCEGEADLEIYGDSFMAKRAEAYGVTAKQYFDKTDAFFYGLTLFEYDSIQLYFDGDMFCAVNLLTLLAFFETKKYKGEIIFNFIEGNGRADVLERRRVTLGIYLGMYERLMIRRLAPDSDTGVIDSKALGLYIEYKKPDSAISGFLKQHAELSDDELCVCTLAKFGDYGVGDNAIYSAIKKLRKKTQTD